MEKKKKKCHVLETEKNFGISPTIILPLLLLYIASVTISKERSHFVYFFQPRVLFQTSFVFER